MTTHSYDIIVVGGGTGRDVVLAAKAQGLRVALVERGPLGGTCHNRGCMPSKMLIHSADVADVVRNGERFGVKSTIQGIDFRAIVGNVFAELDAETEEREADLITSPNVDFLRHEARFTGPKTLQLDGNSITAERIVIAGGTRPSVVPIPGLDRTPYLTSDEALRLSEQPRRLAIIGGGYIATELAHFFGALGTDVTIMTIEDRLLEREDVEVARWFTREAVRRYRLELNAHIEEVSHTAGEFSLRLQGRDEPIRADQVLVATGRRPNTDLLDVAAAGIDMDRAGFVQVDPYFETNVEGVWAFGDIIGVLPLKHVAVRQARLLIRNLFSGQRHPMSYNAIPHAVFSSPQVAGVGKTEEELRREAVPYKVGRHELRHTAQGMVLKENGLVKILAGSNDELLGCHIVGPHASILIQEAVVAMNASGRLDAIVDAVHAHPALPQIVEAAANAALHAPVRTPRAVDGKIPAAR